MSDIDLKLCDLLEFSKMCGPEYNMPELSDRILVIDVMLDGWETTGILNRIPTTEITESCEETSPTSVRQNSSKKPLSETLESPQSEEKSLNNVTKMKTRARIFRNYPANRIQSSHFQRILPRIPVSIWSRKLNNQNQAIPRVISTNHCASTEYIFTPSGFPFKVRIFDRCFIPVV